jgi:hypothetical protein
MVSMVYSDPAGMDWPIANAFRIFMSGGGMFTGPRTFRAWAFAVAYALLPADPNITTTGRRRVHKGSSGRWLVTQTHAVRHGPALIPAPDRRDLRDFPGTHLPLVGGA